MENHIHPGECRLRRRQGHDDQVLIAAALEKTGDVFRLPVVQRQERQHGFAVRKCHHHDGRRSRCLRAGKGGVSLAELLEPCGKPVDILGRPGAVDIEMRRPGLKPSTLRERRTGNGCDGRFEKADRQELERQGDNPDRTAAPRPAPRVFAGAPSAARRDCARIHKASQRKRSGERCHEGEGAGLRPGRGIAFPSVSPASVRLDWRPSASIRGRIPPRQSA